MHKEGAFISNVPVGAAFRRGALALCVFFIFCFWGRALPRVQPAAILSVSASVFFAQPLPGPYTPAPKPPSAPAPGPALTAAPDPAPAKPQAVMLPVENILQHPELPNGCEAASLAIVLNYLDIRADKTDLAYNYIPLQPIISPGGQRTAGNPHYTYTGNPGEYGYYCFARPVVMAANSYLQNQNAPLRAQNRTGADEDELAGHLAGGRPVVVWKTLDGAAPQTLDELAWQFVSTGEVYSPYVNLHVVVLCGYDAENFYFCDPLGYAPAMPRAVFMKRYTELGSHAMILS